MSADGEVEVSVRAEGVDEAAGEMGGDALAETADGGGAPGGGGGDGGGGRFGRLLTRIATLLAFLGPILQVLGVVSGILEAFVAPLAVLLLRLLAPVLRIMLQVLPVWFDIMDFVNTLVKNTSPLLRMLGVIGILISVFMNADGKLGEIRDRLVSEVKSAITSLPGQIWSFMQRLPGRIATSLSNLLPDFGGGGGILPDFGGGGGDTGDGLLSDIRDALGGGGGGGGRDRQPVVNLGGGLSTFVDRVERDPNTELQ